MKQVALYIFFALCSLACSINSTAQDRKTFEKVKSFIPPDYEILDAVSGDLDGDRISDFALVLKSKNEDQSGDELRPLLLLKGSKSGQLSLLQRNDSVVLCRGCGGIFGDPFQRVDIKDGVLSIEHNVGGTWRWSRNISFRYDAELTEFVLDSDAIRTYREFNSGGQTAAKPLKEEDGKQLFRSYSFSKNR